MRTYFVLACIFFIYSCNTRYRVIANYYYQNNLVHDDIVRIGEKLSKAKGLKILLKKNIASHQIHFLYLSEGSDTYQKIAFDSSLSALIGGFPDVVNKEIVIELVQKFDKTIYHAIKIEPNSTFFAYDYLSPASNYEIGLLFVREGFVRNKSDIHRKLNDSVFLFKDIVP